MPTHMPRLTASARRYTRRVSFMRGTLWVFVAGIISLVIWIASDNGNGDNAMRVVFSNIPKTAQALQNIMMKPHYQGVDVNNQPFTVTAEQAIQLDKENVSLVKVRGDMTLHNGVWIAVDANTGELNITNKQLELHDHVNLFYEGGYEFRSNFAHVDIQKGNAYGNMPVEGQGPPGTLTADSFDISERGAVIRFHGNVKMKLYR